MCVEQTESCTFCWQKLSKSCRSWKLFIANIFWLSLAESCCCCCYSFCSFCFLCCFNFTYISVCTSWILMLLTCHAVNWQKRLTRSRLLRARVRVGVGALDSGVIPGFSSIRFHAIPTHSHRFTSAKNSRRRQTDMSLLIWALEKFRVKCAAVGGGKSTSQITLENSLFADNSFRLLLLLLRVKYNQINNCKHLFRWEDGMAGMCITFHLRLDFVEVELLPTEIDPRHSLLRQPGLLPGLWLV